MLLLFKFSMGCKEIQMRRKAAALGRMEEEHVFQISAVQYGPFALTIRAFNALTVMARKTATKATKLDQEKWFSQRKAAAYPNWPLW
jgi:hypothetical protein